MPTDSTISPPGRRLEQVHESLDDIIDGLGGEPRAYISLAQAAKLFPPNRAGKAVHVATLTRYIHPGIPARAHGREGQRIAMRAVRRPGGWMTCREWVAEFLAAVTADRTGHQPVPAPARTSAIRRKAAERADRALDKIGI